MPADAVDFFSFHHSRNEVHTRTFLAKRFVSEPILKNFCKSLQTRNRVFVLERRLRFRLKQEIAYQSFKKANGKGNCLKEFTNDQLEALKNISHKDYDYRYYQKLHFISFNFCSVTAQSALIMVRCIWKTFSIFFSKKAATQAESSSQLWTSCSLACRNTVEDSVAFGEWTTSIMLLKMNQTITSSRTMEATMSPRKRWAQLFR